MTKEEISKLIFDKVIPISLIWEDGQRYYLRVFTDNGCTSTLTSHVSGDWYFPNWDDRNNQGNYIDFMRNDANGFVHKFNKPTLQETLTDIVYFFEINKNKCKEITYYQK